MSDIDHVRRFNRIVTQRVGALDNSYLARGRPLGQARVIHELGAGGETDLQALRAALGLDSGYMSRLLRSLEKQGLIAVHAKPEDSRARTVALTPAGEAEFSAYNAMSDRLAEGMFGSLDAGRRARLVAAMDEVVRLLQAATLAIAPEPADSADATWCMRRYYEELLARFEIDFDPEDPDLWKVADMMAPNGAFLIARLEGAPVGCGGLRRFDAQTGEIKRVWISPDVRGAGVASRIMDELEALARQAGYTRVILDTNGALKEAQAMYRKRGYRDIERYNDNPYAQCWFEKGLRPAKP